jgi:hypothetical protein
MFLQVSTGRLEKFLELPETGSVIPASCILDQQPETETVLQDVTCGSHNFSKVSNNLFIFFGIYPLHAEESISGNNIIDFYQICIHPVFIRAQNMFVELFNIVFELNTHTVFFS